MKRWIKPIGVFLLAAGALGAIVLVSGVVPIKASSGHWPITRWLLTFAKQRSVALHSSATPPSDLADPDLILRGAGAYHTNCFFCHGSPEFPQRVVAGAMAPAPPYLTSQISKYSDQELFHIVKHGIKFTGMPAWPALERDEEVWAVVAFLKRLPELEGEGYRQLVWGDAEAGARSVPSELADAAPHATIALCFRCHASDGSGRGEAAFPDLAGQSERYLANSLRAYANGERHSGVMQPVASGLLESEIDAFARYYSKLSQPEQPPSSRDADAIARGEIIAEQGVPQRRIPSCVDCHDPQGVERKDAYPILSGQPSGYLVRQLELFKAGHRGGTEYAHLMHPVVKRLTSQQMRDVAAYFESQRR